MENFTKFKTAHLNLAAFTQATTNESEEQSPQLLVNASLPPLGARCNAASAQVRLAYQ